MKICAKQINTHNWDEVRGGEYNTVYSWLFSRIDLEPQKFSTSKIGLLSVEIPFYCKGVVI